MSLNPSGSAQVLNWFDSIWSMWVWIQVIKLKWLLNSTLLTLWTKSGFGPTKIYKYVCVGIVVFWLISFLLCRVVIDNNACENATVIQVWLVLFPSVYFHKIEFTRRNSLFQSKKEEIVFYFIFKFLYWNPWF